MTWRRLADPVTGRPAWQDDAQQASLTIVGDAMVVSHNTDEDIRIAEWVIGEALDRLRSECRGRPAVQPKP